MTDQDDPSVPKLKPLRVRRKKVLNALLWLKKHHFGYHDIIIVENNLSWMEGKDEAQMESVQFKRKIKSKRNIMMEKRKDCVSQNQCYTEISDEEFDSSTLGWIISKS